MSWSNSGSGRDKEELNRVVDGTEQCPDGVKSVLKSSIGLFPEGADISFSSYGHVNPDGTGNFHIDIIGKDVPSDSEGGAT